MNYLKNGETKRLVRIVTKRDESELTYDVVYGKVLYVGDVLSDEQVINLRRYGNTLIAYSFYERCLQTVGKQALVSAINELVGKSCSIEIKNDDLPARGKTVIVKVNKKQPKKKEVE